jgi:hypothetical protein
MKRRIAVCAGLALAFAAGTAAAQSSYPRGDSHVPQQHGGIHAGPYGTIIDSWENFDPLSPSDFAPRSTYRNPYTNEAMQNRGRACPQPYRNPYTNEAMQQRRQGRYDPYWCFRRAPWRW